MRTSSKNGKSKSLLLIIFSVSLVLIFTFIACELPETQTHFDKPKPAVWAIFSPEKPICIMLSKLTSIDDTIQTSYIHGASLTLSWGESSIALIETTISFGTYPYIDTVNIYTAPDTAFRVSEGVHYRLSGHTIVGDFSDTFTVPTAPRIEFLSPDTAVFDNTRDWAFVVRIANANDDFEYRGYVGVISCTGYGLPDSLSERCPSLRWVASDASSGVAIPWCKFYCEGEHILIIKAIEHHLVQFLDYYNMSDYSGMEPYLFNPPGNESYIGVIGAYAATSETVWVEFGSRAFFSTISVDTSMRYEYIGSEDFEAREK